MKEYTFCYYGWIPSYRDFDTDWISITAATEDEAWAQFRSQVKFVKSAGIESIKEI